MPSLVVIGQQIEERRIGDFVPFVSSLYFTKIAQLIFYQNSPAYILPKQPSLNMVKQGKLPSRFTDFVLFCMNLGKWPISAAYYL